MLIKETKTDLLKRASQGTRIIGESAFAMLGGNLNQEIRKKRIKEIADETKELLKEKKTITIPEIMEVLHVNAIEAIEAVEILREAGIAEKVRH